MTLQDQAEEVAMIIHKYSTMYGLEPSAVVKKSFPHLRAALGLAVISQRESDLSRQGAIPTGPQYSQTALERDRSGAPTRVREESIIPFDSLSGNKPQQLDLEQLINTFR